MAFLAIARQILCLLKRGGEPTLKELLSDSAVKAVMEADGVDPLMLEAQLHDMASLTRHANRNRPRALP